MYIEFRLSDQADVIAATQANKIINNALHAWSNRYDIPYNTKIIKYTKRITFDRDEHYTLFSMTWNPDQKFRALSRWRIVSDLNNKKVFDSRV